MARPPRARRQAPQHTSDVDIDIEALSSQVSERFSEVPWRLFNSKDLAASGETRFAVSRIQEDLLKVATADPARAGRIWDEHVPGFVPRPAELPASEKEAEIENAIAPGRRRRRAQPEAFLETPPIERPDPQQAATRVTSPPAPEAASPDRKAASDRALGNSDDEKTARIRLLQEGLEKQYLKADDKYHFRDRDGDVAFEAQARKLVTRHDTPVVVTSMIDLAETRGWSSLKLTGTQEFRREAWLQANLRDLEVSGYQPDKLDKAKLEDLRSERAAQGPLNTVSEQRPRQDWTREQKPGFEPIANADPSEPRIPLTSGQDQFLRVMEATMRHRGDAPEAIAKARELGNARLTSTRVHYGKLVEVGTGPYLDRKDENMSHFVTLEDDKGKSAKIWGADLPRALAESGAEPGQVVAVAFRGRNPMTIDVDVKDKAGHVIRTQKQSVMRNSWEIVQFDKLRDEARASVVAAVQRQENPEQIKVFDRAARPAAVPAVERAPDRGRSRERTL